MPRKQIASRIFKAGDLTQADRVPDDRKIIAPAIIDRKVAARKVRRQVDLANLARATIALVNMVRAIINPRSIIRAIIDLAGIRAPRIMVPISTGALPR